MRESKRRKGDSRGGKEIARRNKKEQTKQYRVKEKERREVRKSLY